jgi:hypothetical protein
VYIISNYTFCLLLLAAFWSDPFLSTQPVSLRLICYGVLGLLIALTFPLWNLSYGKDLKHFEEMEKEWFEGNKA